VKKPKDMPQASEFGQHWSDVSGPPSPVDKLRAAVAADRSRRRGVVSDFRKRQADARKRALQPDTKTGRPRTKAAKKRPG
jgi:hypothetical protein